jgi:hypothetical protein
LVAVAVLPESGPEKLQFTIQALLVTKGSCISNRFHAHGLLIDLMMEAARTSEMLVNFYQTTWRYNPEEAIFVIPQCS